MGYGFWPYRIDLQELARLPALGTAAMGALERRLKGRFAELTSDFEDELAERECE